MPTRRAKRCFSVLMRDSHKKYVENVRKKPEKLTVTVARTAPKILFRSYVARTDATPGEQPVSKITQQWKSTPLSFKSHNANTRLKSS